MRLGTDEAVEGLPASPRQVTMTTRGSTSASGDDAGRVAGGEDGRGEDGETLRPQASRAVLERDPILELDDLPRLRRLIYAAGERQRREVANG